MSPEAILSRVVWYTYGAQAVALIVGVMEAYCVVHCSLRGAHGFALLSIIGVGISYCVFYFATDLRNFARNSG